jgi:hypothetical protein
MNDDKTSPSSKKVFNKFLALRGSLIRRLYEKNDPTCPKPCLDRPKR